MKQKFKRQAHLIGEAFPDHFTITLAIQREASGGISPTCDVIANPKNETEVHALRVILLRISPENLRHE